MNIPQEFEDIFRGVELTEDETRTLTWIDGWESRTVENLRSAIQKAQATALSTLQAENEKLRAEMEQVKRERDTAVEYLRGQCRYCKRNLVCTIRKGPHSNCWEWRGPQKED